MYWLGGRVLGGKVLRKEEGYNFFGNGSVKEKKNDEMNFFRFFCVLGKIV